MCNAEGISEEDVNKLQTELRKMAADLVGEVSYTCTALVCLTYSVPHSFFIVSSYLLNCCENKEVMDSLTIGENYYIYA